MAGYEYIKGDCLNDCRVDPFDTHGFCTGDCGETCIDCVRAAGPCSCTCNLLHFAVIAEIDGVPEDSGSEIPPWEFCTCLGAEDLKSVDPTFVTTGFYLRWNYDDLHGGEGAADMTPAAIAARTCPDNTDWTLQFYGVYGNTDLHCIASLLPERSGPNGIGPLLVNGSADPIVNPGASTGYGYYVQNGPALADGSEDRYLCGTLRTDVTALPTAVLAVIRNSCGVIMSLCPIAANLNDLVACPIPPPACCYAQFDDLFVDQCDPEESNRTTIHFAISVFCPEGGCNGLSGTGRVKILDPSAEPDEIIFDHDGLSGTFSVDCTGDPDNAVTIQLDWNSNETCPGGTDCTFTITIYKCINLTTAAIFDGAC